MEKLEAILFDLEGTLLDSTYDIRQGVNLMLKDQDRPPLSLEQVKSFIGEGMMELCRRSLEATGGVPTDDLYPFVQKLITHYRAVRPDPQQIYPHVRDFLEQFKKLNIKMGICTNKNEAATLAILEELDLLRYFGFVAGGDTYTVHKPHPGHLQGVLDALGTTAKQSVFVGDGPNDVAASVRADMNCIIVTHGSKTELDDMDFPTVITEFDELLEAVKGLGYEI